MCICPYYNYFIHQLQMLFSYSLKILKLPYQIKDIIIFMKVIAKNMY